MCKMRFFRDMLRSDIEGERAALQRGPVGLLPLLPKEFTRDDVRALRIAQGMKPDPKVVHHPAAGYIMKKSPSILFIGGDSFC